MTAIEQDRSEMCPVLVGEIKGQNPYYHEGRTHLGLKGTHQSAESRQRPLVVLKLCLRPGLVDYLTVTIAPLNKESISYIYASRRLYPKIGIVFPGH